MSNNYIKREPLRLSLEDYHLILKLINEIEPSEMSDAEKALKIKVLRIASNIQKAIAYSMETGRATDPHEVEGKP